MEIVLMVVFGLSTTGACLMGLLGLTMAYKFIGEGDWGGVGLYLLAGLGWAVHPLLIWNGVDATWLLLLLGIASIALTVGAFWFLVQVLGGY